MENKTFVTSDLPLTAYLVINGLNLKKAVKVSNGKFEFVLEDNEGVAQDLAVAFINSEFCAYDNTIRSIKKILYTK